uniref:Uncharacterized protein n=1 Tax=Octopus bimaculoides TaxID=37653 RepID=A0A0L8H4W6_OCTBM
MYPSVFSCLGVMYGDLVAMSTMSIDYIDASLRSHARKRRFSYVFLSPIALSVDINITFTNQRYKSESSYQYKQTGKIRNPNQQLMISSSN